MGLRGSRSWAFLYRMATIITGSIVAEIRGSVGSETYSRNAYGAYVKTRTSPTNPNTTPQQNARTRMSNAVAAWQSLSMAEQHDYITEARNRTEQNRLGLPRRVTGYTLFLRQYISCVRAGITPLTSVQAKALPDVMRPSVLTFSESALSFLNQFAVTDAAIKGFLFATPYRPSSQVSFNPSTARLISVLNSASGTNAVNFTSAYTAVFGALAGHAGDLISIALPTVRMLSAEYSAQLWHTDQIAA